MYQHDPGAAFFSSDELRSDVLRVTLTQHDRGEPTAGALTPAPD